MLDWKRTTAEIVYAYAIFFFLYGATALFLATASRFSSPSHSCVLPQYVSFSH
jgi:hypothetical protein